MKQTRRKVLGSAVSLLGAFALPAIKSHAADAVTLTISYSYGPYGELFDEMARQFEAANNGVKIQTMQPVMSSHEEHLQQVLRAAVTGDLPDVSFQGNHLIRVLAQRGLPVELDPFIAKETSWSNFGLTSGAQSVAQIQGKIYGLGFQASAPVIFYNSDLVARAGGNAQQLPTTWPEIVELAKRISAIETKPMGCYFDYSSSGAYTFQALVGGLGGTMMSPDDRTIAFDGDAGKMALSILRQFATEGGMQDMSRSQAYQAFSAGTVGIIAAASSNLAQFESQAGGRFEVLVGPWPLIESGGRLPTGGRTAVMFTRDPKKQSIGWEYIKFAEGPVGQTLMVKVTGGVPNNQRAIDAPEYLGKFYQERPNYLATVKQLSSLSEWYSFPGENTVKIGATINNYLQSVVALKSTPEAAMQGMVEDVQGLLPK